MEVARVARAGVTDDDLEDRAGNTWYADADGDGWGDETPAVLTCTPCEGSVATGFDDVALGAPYGD